MLLSTFVVTRTYQLPPKCARAPPLAMLLQLLQLRQAVGHMTDHLGARITQSDRQINAMQPPGLLLRLMPLFNACCHPQQIPFALHLRRQSCGLLHALLLMMMLPSPCLPVTPPCLPVCDQRCHKLVWMQHLRCQQLLRDGARLQCTRQQTLIEDMHNERLANQRQL